MQPNLLLIVLAGLLVAAGVYLLLERSLTRILVGLLLASNGVNLLFLVAAGPAKLAAFIGLNDPDEMTDPLPQAMVLTAIVITLASLAFLLTMAYRSFQLNGHDEVADDVEDSQIRRLAALDEASDSYDEHDVGMPDEDEDETDSDVMSAPTGPDRQAPDTPGPSGSDPVHTDLAVAHDVADGRAGADGHADADGHDDRDVTGDQP